jgi:hypothetical protein
MHGLIILTSITFVVFITYKMIKIKVMKYIASPILGLLYGFMLFFIGMGIGGVLYFTLAILPVIISLIYIVNRNYAK